MIDPKRSFIFAFLLSISFIFSPAISSVFASAETGFSGRNYLKMESPVRTFYVSGFVHGMSIIRPMADKDTIVPWLSKCVEEMAPIQFEKTLTDYIKKHVELQDARLDVLAFLAFKSACRK